MLVYVVYIEGISPLKYLEVLSALQWEFPPQPPALAYFFPANRASQRQMQI